MNKTPHLKVVTLQESNFRDPVATLRVIANEIEAGKYGPVACIGLVMLADEMSVFAMGPDSEATSAALLFQAGIMELAMPILRKGRE